MAFRNLRLIGACLGLLISFPQAAQAITVTQELFLSIDVSGSISNSEYNLQRQGYADAFSQPGVQAAILGVPGGIAVAVGQWASTSFPLSYQWTQLNSQSSIDSFVSFLRTMPRLGDGGTCVACAIQTARGNILDNDFESTVQTIDVSGDGVANRRPGTNNGNEALAAQATRTQRNLTQQAGITINGLPIGGNTVTNFYRNNVITTNGLLVPAANFNAFNQAVASKIANEVVPAPFSGMALVPLLALMGRLRKRYKPTILGK